MRPATGNHPEAGARLQRLAHVRELRHVRPVEGERLGALPPRGRREALVQRRELLPHGAPDRLLLGRVGDARQRVAVAVRERQAGDFVAARAVDRVAEPGMVGVEGNELTGARGDRASAERGRSASRPQLSQVRILPPSQLLDESLALLLVFRLGEDPRLVEALRFLQTLLDRGARGRRGSRARPPSPSAPAACGRVCVNRTLRKFSGWRMRGKTTVLSLPAVCNSTSP